MIRNYFAIALRNIRQNPLYASINIFSLAIGLAASLIIYLFIADESAFDKFHTDYQHIYRLDEVQNFPGTNLQKVALSMPGMGPAMLEDFPEIETFTRFWNRNKTMIQKDEARFLIDNVARVDSTFLEIFQFAVTDGDRHTALDQPNSVALTHETALKFFPDVQSAMGNSVRIYDNEYKITAILDDVPENSHLQFDALVSLTTVTQQDSSFNKRWGSNFLNTYLVLKPNVDVPALEKKFPEFMVRQTGNEDVNDYYTLFLQPLVQVHLASMDIEHDYNNYRKFNGEYLDVFAIVGIFILIIASVNFMNLTTARASHRWKEVGIRKSIGARKAQLFGQFIFESTMLALVALVIAVVLDLIFIPLLNDLVGRQLSILAVLGNPLTVSGVIVMALVLGLLTGIYPSLYMTSFNLSRILKGGGKADGRSIFRSGLVVVQFGLALAMIVSTLVVVQQLFFMRNKDIGFDKDHMLLVGMSRTANEKYEAIKADLLANSNVLGVTASGQRIGNNFHQWGFKVRTDTGVANITPSNVNVDYDYLKVYGIQLKEGRDFSKDNIRDNGYAFIINEAFAKELGLKETIGTSAGHGFYNDDSLGTIIGVAKDFNFNSLHYKINTLSMVVHPDWGYDEMSIKINGAQMEQTIATVKAIWDRHVQDFPFTYTFLDQHFEQLYRSDTQMSAVVSIMAVLAILLSCMGLFGLSAITTERKTKEIGIRKVLGASIGQILALLSKNVALLVVIAFVIVSPITYWMLSVWLESFAFRIGINPLLFVLGAVLTLIIALGTISYHTIRSARANPVKALRYE